MSCHGLDSLDINERQICIFTGSLSRNKSINSIMKSISYAVFTLIHVTYSYVASHSLLQSATDCIFASLCVVYK